MMKRMTFLLPLAFATALGCALIGGVFFAFSTFVMRALARLPAPTGIAAMQSINVVASSPVFMVALFGTALACLVVAVFSALSWGDPGIGPLVAGSVLYLAGTIGVTIVSNVPRNDALARVDPADAAAVPLWTAYLRDWTGWNHVRAVSALAAAALLLVGLLAAISEQGAGG